jgi:hypothetical protein
MGLHEEDLDLALVAELVGTSALEVCHQRNIDRE